VQLIKNIKRVNCELDVHQTKEKTADYGKLATEHNALVYNEKWEIR